jgi:hypothetical protein
VSPVLRARLPVASRHLDAVLSAYADRTLPAATLLTCDQHVAICPRCRAAVDAERRLLSSLRSAVTPGLSSRLESALLDLAAHTACPAPTSGPSPLPVVRRAAPAMHHSPVRSMVLAGLAAGASAAAAWSLGLSGVGPPGGSMPVVRLPDPASTVTLTTASTQTVLVAGTQSGVPDMSRGWAQSLKLGTIEP